MKKGLILTLAVGGFFAFTTIGCGTKYTPLTQEQITAQADSLFTAQKDAKLAELQAACAGSLEAQVNAKVEAMKTASETASK